MTLLVITLTLAGDELEDVPLRSDALVVPVHAVGVLPAGLGYLALRRPSSAVEQRVWRIVAARAMWFVTVLLMLVICIPMAVGLTPSAVLIARNTALLFAAGVVSALLLEPVLAWAGPFVIGASMHLYGTSAAGTARPWAVMHFPPTDLAAWTVCGVVVAVAATGYALRDITA